MVHFIEWLLFSIKEEQAMFVLSVTVGLPVTATSSIITFGMSGMLILPRFKYITLSLKMKSD